MLRDAHRTSGAENYAASPAVRVLIVALSARTGGGGCSHLVSQIAALSARSEMDLTIHAVGNVGRELQRAAPQSRVLIHSHRPLPLRLLYEQVVLASRARNYDVVYVPGNLGLVLGPSAQVVCQQNAWYYTAAVRAFRRRRCPMRMRTRLLLETAVARASIRRARTVIVVSETMRAMVESDVGALPHIRVITSATPQLRPGASPPPDAAYALAVAPDDPHKDLGGLVDAFARNPDLPPLIIVGRCSEARRIELHKRGSGRVSLVGQVDDRQRIANFYGAAACLVAHSFFESFGMTPAEALLCGTPVAATDIPAHREVCGDRACYYDPTDADALAHAVRAACAMPRPKLQVGARTWRDNAAELAAELTLASRHHDGPRLRPRGRR